MRRFLSFALLLCLLLPAAAQQEELTNLSLSIKDRLLYLKQESAVMKTQLETLSKNLKASETERKALMEQSTKLSNSLMNINKQLSDCYNKIERDKVVIKILLYILVIRTIAMIAGYVLYAKGIKLPRWLDILL